MKRVILTMAVVMLMGSQAFGLYGLRKWRLDVVDADLGEVIASGNFTITVYESGSGSAATIYADEYATAKTNPVTPGSDSAAAAGKLVFYTASTPMDIRIASSVYAGTVKIDGVTITKHRLLYPLAESVGNVSAGTLSATGAATLSGAVTLGDAAADILTSTGTWAGATPFVFEGATADAFEMSWTLTDPTADRTVTWADTGGTVWLSSLATNAADIVNSVWGVSNGITLEGATADAFELFITLIDPTADRTFTIPNYSGTGLISTLATNAPEIANSVWGISNGWVFEGATADDFETTWAVTDPTADRTVTIGDRTGTIVTSDSGSLVYYATVELTNGDIKGLQGAAKELVAAPGAGNLIEFVSAVLILDYGSEVLTESADNMAIEYDNGTGSAVSGTIEATSFIDASADTIKTVIAAEVANMTAASSVNKNIALINNGDGEYGGNASADTTWTVKIAYRIHAVGL